MEWRKVKESLPPKHHYVLLLADRFWNVPDGVPDMKVTATGYLADSGNVLYWAVFGERGMRLESFTHWVSIHDGLATEVDE